MSKSGSMVVATFSHPLPPPPPAQRKAGKLPAGRIRIPVAAPTANKPPETPASESTMATEKRPPPGFRTNLTAEEKPV